MASNTTDIQHPNRCRICGLDFTRRADLITHFEANHAGNQPFRCAACGADFGRFSTLRRHQRQNCPANRAPPAAGTQGEESSKDAQASEDARSSEDDPSSEVEVEDVNTDEDHDESEDMGEEDSSSGSEAALPSNSTSDSGSAPEAVHPPSHSPSGSSSASEAVRPPSNSTDTSTRHWRHTCRICGEDLQTQRSLQRHFRAEHGSDRVHRCQHCGSAMTHASSLVRHQRTCQGRTEASVEDEQEEHDASGDGDEEDQEEEDQEDEVYEGEEAAQEVEAEAEASAGEEEASQQEDEVEEQVEEAPEFDDPSYAAELLELMTDPHAPCCPNIGLPACSSKDGGIFMFCKKVTRRTDCEDDGIMFGGACTDCAYIDAGCIWVHPEDAEESASTTEATTWFMGNMNYRKRIHEKAVYYSSGKKLDTDGLREALKDN
ncbi:hypothetical protein BC567DRAFT_209643 [Phyllosticta citribraziliensis]